MLYLAEEKNRIHDLACDDGDGDGDGDGDDDGWGPQRHRQSSTSGFDPGSPTSATEAPLFRLSIDGLGPSGPV